MKMKIIYESNNDLPNLNREIENITNNAILLVNEIEINKEKKYIKIPFQRYEIINYKSIFLGLKNKPNYNRNNKIKSYLLVRGFKKYNMNNNCASNNIELTVLFGFRIKNKKIYLSSFEETKGKQLFEMEVEVDKYNIELNDY